MTSHMARSNKSLKVLPSLVSSAYAAAVSGGHVIFSETELAVVRTRSGLPVSLSFSFRSVLSGIKIEIVLKRTVF